MIKLAFTIGNILLEFAIPSNAQTSTSKTVLNSDYITSPRAEAMSGAISTSANGSDSSYYNPATIGGIFSSSNNLINQLELPFFGGAANENAMDLWSDIVSSGGDADPAIGESIVSANEGKRQYARVSSGFYLEFLRTSVHIFSDIQFAAVHPNELAVDPVTGSNIIDANYRSTLGTGIGFSGETSNQNLYFGTFVSNISSKVYSDAITYDDLIDANVRDTLLKDQSREYSGLSINAGLL